MPDRASARLRGWFARRQLPLYFALAFLLSWSIWPLTLANPASSPLIPFGPAIAAVVVTALAGGSTSVWQLLRQLTRWKVPPGWYAIALSPFLLAAVAAALTVASGAPAPGPHLYADLPFALPAALLSSIVIVGLFEELGWRGYALPRMQRTHSALWSALVLGGVWALWHLPELISDPGQRPLAPFVTIVLAQSVILTWLYNRTNGALPIAVIFHAAFNTAGLFLLPEFVGPYYLLIWWIMTVLYAAFAVAVVARVGAPRRTATG